MGKNETSNHNTHCDSRTVKAGPFPPGRGRTWNYRNHGLCRSSTERTTATAKRRNGWMNDRTKVKKKTRIEREGGYATDTVRCREENWSAPSAIRRGRTASFSTSCIVSVLSSVFIHRYNHKAISSLISGKRIKIETYDRCLARREHVKYYGLSSFPFVPAYKLWDGFSVIHQSRKTLQNDGGNAFLC